MEREVVKGKEMPKTHFLRALRVQELATSASYEVTDVERSVRTHVVPPLTFPTPFEPLDLVDLLNSFAISTSL